MNQLLHALGSIKVRHNKNTMNQAPTMMEDPEQVILPMSQHIGAPCKPTVKKGDHVKIGQCIGDSDAFLCVPIYASISGEITKIRQSTNMFSGNETSMVIKNDHQHEIMEGLEPPKVETREDFINAVKASGVVGCGGASFPTFVKFNSKNLDQVDTLIINGAECEPFLTSDYRQMIDHPQDIIDGIVITMDQLELKKTIIGIEGNKPKAIELLKSLIAEQGLADKITVQTLKSSYPQGAERVLIYETTGKLIDAGVLPADVGVIVSNVTSIAEINKYLKTGMPLVHKTLTVDGTAIKNPTNITVPIGAQVKDVVEATGGFKNEPKRIIAGGPMMGKTLDNVDASVIRANGAILCFSGPEAETAKQTQCINCGKCHEACPFHLLPKLYSDAYERGDIEPLKKYKLMQCMECGSCSYVCPARRPLSFVNHLGKGAIKEAGKK